MNSLFTRLGIPLLILTASKAALAELATVSGLNALPEVELSRLTEQDGSALGAKALAIHAADWKHGETEHFIYHFQRSYVATPVSVEAEFHFRVVSKELGKSGAAWSGKAHIYIFEQAEDWASFQTVGGLEPWTGGIQSGGSLFIVRNPAYKFTDNSLGHEIAHLVLRRFYGYDIPLWLNEGFAQYVSKGAHASYQRARGYLAKPTSNGVPREKLFPLRALVTMSYPPAEQVDIFYDQSERLVRFLVAADRASFLELLELSAAGHALDAALTRTSNGRFANVAALEDQFVAYAAKDAATSFAER
ncbi:MAG: peptidase MA family metallohydrolase [Chthoniobacterales bacterium]